MLRGTCIAALVMLVAAACERIDETPGALVVDSAWLTVVEMPERFRLVHVDSAAVLGIMFSPLDEQIVELRPLVGGA